MKKKQSASSARARQRVKSVRHMRDSQLDLADIPEATDEQLRRARRVGRPVTGNAKQLIASALPRGSSPSSAAWHQTVEALSNIHPRTTGTRRQQKGGLATVDGNLSIRAVSSQAVTALSLIFAPTNFSVPRGGDFHFS